MTFHTAETIDQVLALALEPAAADESKESEAA